MNETGQGALVSVIIPAYNRASLLTRAIQSVLDQSYGQLEVLVIDDGSTDNTAEVVAKFEDQRIRYVRNPSNRGQSYSRNRGVEFAQGDLVAFLDSDDYWLPNKLVVSLAALEAHPAVCLVYTNVLLSQENGTEPKVKLGPQYFKSGRLFREVLIWQVVCHLPTWVFKRECFLSVGGFDEELPEREDREFLVRFAHRYELHGIADPLTVVSCRDSGRVSNTTSERTEASYAKIMATIRELAGPEPWGPRAIRMVDSRYEADLGKWCLAEHQNRKARHHLLRAVLADPLNYKAYPYLLGATSWRVHGLLKTVKGALTR